MERKKIWLARTCDVDRSSAHTTPKIILGGFRAPAAGCSHFAVHRQYTKLQIYCRGGGTEWMLSQPNLGWLPYKQYRLCFDFQYNYKRNSRVIT